MAKSLNQYNAEIVNGSKVESSHIKQFADAFTGEEAYDIEISGSLTVNGIEIKSGQLSSGTNYITVLGMGTPEENAAELQAAYNAAKTMPRHIGTFNSGQHIEIYKGQTFVNSTIPIKFFIANTDFTGTIGAAPVGTFEGRDLQSELDAALAKRVTVIVAPGEYNFGEFTTFNINTSRIDVKSLTGKRDVIINSVNVSSDWVYVSGINCRLGRFNVGSQLSNSIFENCEGGEASFGGTQSDGIIFASTCIDCKGGDYSFGAAGTALCYCIRCVGGHYSFGGANGIASGTFEDCKGGNNSFGEFNASGKFIRCEGGNNSFGSSEGSASGQFYYCIGGNYSFGKFASGQFIDCTAMDYSFGWGTAGDGYFSGIARRCIGGEGCFKSGGSGSANAKIHYCEAIYSEIISIPHVYCIQAGEAIP